ncbi:hypothetical protein GCM10009826_15380 [Humibacillus xanthopallidus]
MSSADPISATSTIAMASAEGIGAAGSTMIRTADSMRAPIPTIALTICTGRSAACVGEPKGLGDGTGDSLMASSLGDRNPWPIRAFSHRLPAL